MTRERRKSEPTQISELIAPVLENIQSMVDDGKIANADYTNDKIQDLAKRFILNCPTRFRRFLNMNLDAEYFEALDAGDSISIKGAVGAGKTTTALAIAYQWILKEVVKAEDLTTVIIEKLFFMVTSTDYMFSLRNSYEHGRAEGLREQYARVKLLLIDDLFATRINDNVHEEILYLINERYQWKRPTILTMNKSLNDVSEVDARIASRLGGGLVVDIGQKDLRTDDN